MTILEKVQQQLLLPAELTEQQLQQALNGMLGRQIDYADFYFQSIVGESWVLEDGIVKEGNYSSDCGVGVRAVSDDKTGFAYSDEISLLTLKNASKAAQSIAKLGQSSSVALDHSKNQLQLYDSINPLTVLPDADKVALLKRAEEVARAEDPRVKQVVVSLAASHENMLVMATDGTLAADIRPMVRMNVSVIVEDNGRREQGYQGAGGRVDYRFFLKENCAEELAKQAVKDALIALTAKPAPAGMMPVVLGPGWPGVLLHEAIGHGLEGDFNRRGTSAFAGRIGERVASPLCTIVDDGTLPNLRGSLNVDDEGTPSQCTTLIENGVLKAYMQDKLNARLMKMPLTGNARRESYASLPMPRMTNTYMLAGKDDPAEIIRGVKKGLYAVNFGGGQVDITNGKFVFSASEAYLIEDGKITQPVKGATLVGSGPDVLTKVSKVGRDLKLDRGVGVCGKDGQSVPVCVGQPTLLIDEMTVGGTE